MTSKAKAEPLKLEKALAALEKIVGQLEAEEDLPLDKAIALYEQGVKLSQQCEKKLEQARQKIVQVQENANGGLNEEPLAPQQEASLFDSPDGGDVPF